MKLIVISAIILALSACCVKTTQAATPVREAKKIVRLMARVSDDNIAGASAIVVSKSMLLTAGHFCSAIMDSVFMGLSDGNISIAYRNRHDEIVEMDGARISSFLLAEKEDICLIEKEKHGLPASKILSDYAKVKMGDEIYAVGCPIGIFQVITSGIVSATFTQEMPAESLNEKLMISAPIFHGNSGGAILNKRGEVIGLAVSMTGPYHHIGFAIPSSRMIEYMLENGVEVPQ